MPLRSSFGSAVTAGMMSELERRRKLQEEAAERERFQQDMMRVFGIPLNTPQAGNMLNSHNWYNLQTQQLQDEQRARADAVQRQQEQDAYNRERQAQDDAFSRERFQYGKDQDAADMQYRRERDASDAAQRKEYWDYTHPQEGAVAPKPYTDAQVQWVERQLKSAAQGSIDPQIIMADPAVKNMIDALEEHDPQKYAELGRLYNTALIMQRERANLRSRQPQAQPQIQPQARPAQRTNVDMRTMY